MNDNQDELPCDWRGNHGLNIYKCAGCAVRFLTEEDLVNHTLQMHDLVAKTREQRRYEIAKDVLAAWRASSVWEPPTKAAECEAAIDWADTLLERLEVHRSKCPKKPEVAQPVEIK
jgi:hypothetical protein